MQNQFLKISPFMALTTTWTIIFCCICLHILPSEDFLHPPPFQSQTSSTPSLILKSSPLSLLLYLYNHNKCLTSFLSDCPSMTLCSCWSCSVMVLRILGELAPLTTATKTPPCKKNWWKFNVKKLLKSQFSENRSFF